MSKPQPKARIRNPAQTRTRLLQATVELMAQKGVEGLSIKEAASLAQVSRGVAYQHFEDRDHLVREAREWITERLIRAMTNMDSSRVEAQTEMVARVLLEHPEASQLLISDALAGTTLTAAHPLFQMVRHSLVQQQKAGLARREIDLDVMTFILLGCVSTLLMMSHWREGGDLDTVIKRFSAELTRLMHSGLLMAPATGAPA